MTILDYDIPQDRLEKDDVVPLRFVYSELYIPEGRRKSLPVSFWAESLIVIRVLDPDQAPPAYRIVGPAGCDDPDYVIRAHGGSLWWPLLGSGETLTPSAFRELAAAGDPHLLYHLNIGDGWSNRMDRETYYRNNPPKELLRDDREELQTSAQAAAAEIAFCGEMVLVKAGVPIYYVLPALPTAPNMVVAGPSETGRLMDEGPGVTGPSQNAAISCLRGNQAFGVHEIDDALTSAAFIGAADNFVGQIEHLRPEAADRTAAVVACARAFLDLAFAESTLDHPMCRLLRANVPSFRSAGHDFATFRQIPSETVLDEIASISDDKLIQGHPSRFKRAAELLSRLRKAERTTLSDQDVEALRRLR